MEKYKVLKDLVGFNTIKDKENKEIINYIENYLKNLGFKTEYKTKALVMSIGKEPKLGFLGHTDTVKYTKDFNNPFKLISKNGYLYGLGACDMKGGIAAILDIVSEINFNELKNGMKLYFTYDEEIGFAGIDEIVKSGEKFPKYMIFGEPTNNEVITGSKGLLEYKILFNGIQAHSSNPEKGISANMNAVKFIYTLEEFYKEKIRTEKENEYEIPYTTMNVGLINGGNSINSVSANCEIGLDFRITNKNHINILKNKIHELAKRFNANIIYEEIMEPFVNEIVFLNKTKTIDFITEASKVFESKKIILGPGPITAHEVNENISIDSYKKLIKQYKELIYKILKS